MPWVNPKTDWSAQDGVRNTDLNRIEGNIKELYDKDGVRATTVLYVNGGTGNDASATGSTSAPYKTIMAAVNSLPRNLNGNLVMINIAAGTYAEAVEINGFDGVIELTGSNNAVVIVNSLRIAACRCYLSNINLNVGGSTFVTSGAILIGEGSLTVSGATLTVNYGSTLSLDTVSVSFASSYAIVVSRGSRFHADSLLGSNNTSGLMSQDGSVAAYNTSSLAARGSLYVTAYGGRIYSGAQSSMPTY